MKKSFISIFLAAILAASLSVTVIGVLEYAEAEAKSFAAATKIVQRKALRLMYEAQTEKNLHKLQYARYQYENAEKIVLNFGASSIISKEKSR